MAIFNSYVTNYQRVSQDFTGELSHLPSNNVPAMTGKTSLMNRLTDAGRGRQLWRKGEGTGQIGQNQT